MTAREFADRAVEFEGKEGKDTQVKNDTIVGETEDADA
jgi:hypothetical protein